jgi:AbrB family looped-hinge helix DNA binding protein
MTLLNDMTLKMDRAGRVTLPKPLRDRLGLHAGSDLEIQEIPEGVVLMPANRPPSLVRKGSFLVHTGEIPSGYDILGPEDGYTTLFTSAVRKRRSALASTLST